MLSHTCVWLVLLVAGLISCCYSAQILGIFPVASKSHHMVVSSLMRELASRGHNVTVISAFPQDPPLPNYTDIIVENTRDKMGTSNFFTLPDSSRLARMRGVWAYGVAACNTILPQNIIQHLIHSKDQRYDLIIIETFFNECFYGFAHKFNAPIVAVCAFAGTNYMGNIVGNPSPYSYVPDPFLKYGDHMTFFERLHNAMVIALINLGHDFYYIPQQDALMRKHFNDSTMPYLAAIERRTSVLLVNNHVSLNYPKPLVPNFVQVGGLHIKIPKQLPQDLQKFLDGAPEGVIYFSMGSMLQSSNMPQDMQQAFLNAFSKLKLKVLWKWEVDSLPGQPTNVHFRKWLPQSDILAHKNVHLFITHGGLNSLQEAVYHGVPLIGIPIFGDQFMNMFRVESTGVGRMIDFKNISTESVLSAIEEVLYTPSYKENAKQLSRFFRDRPQTPMELAVYWTEYVIRHKGTSHLRSAALDLSWYQYFLLDVIAVLVGGAVLGLLAVYLSIKALWKKFTKKEYAQKEGKREIQKKKN